MADNTTLDPGTGGDVIATDDIAGVKYQRVKLTDGTADSATVIAAGGGVEAGALRVTVASDSTGVLSVDDNGGSLTVDGSVTADTELASAAALADAAANPTTSVIGAMLQCYNGTTWDRLRGDTTNGLDVDVTRVSGTVTIAGAVTNAGTFATQDSEKVADNAAFTDGTTKVQPVGYVFDEVAGTALTENDAAAARIDAKRAQVGVIEDATTRGQRAAVSAGGALKVDGSAVTQPVSLATLPVTNAGTFAVQDSEKIADDAAFTVGTTKLTPVGYLADQASTDSVNEGDIGAARITLDRKQIMTLAPSVDTEGATIAMNIDVDESEDAVKASAGKILGWFIYNDGATEVYVKFYNDTVANVVVGTTVPVLTIPIPAGSASNISWGDFGGIPFSAAITIAATTAATTADTGAPATNQVIANVLYV